MKSVKFTNNNYIPLGKLEIMDSSIFTETKQYRKKFIRIIIFENEYAKLIEAPELIKCRYIKNVELSQKINIQADENDIVLELAKQIILKKNKLNIPESQIIALSKLYTDEGNDLTIITTWIIQNIDKYLVIFNDNNIRRIIPEMSKNDETFIKVSTNRKLYYSISDYIKETMCSYETARSGLERLTKLELFTKQKLGKKFVYQPTTKLEQIIKGGI